MIITREYQPGEDGHYADGRVYWVSPFRSEMELDYSDEWTEPRRMQGQFAEETMPPMDIETATATLDDGQIVYGFVRTTSFSELSVTKQFVSFAKLLPEFQPLTFYNGAVANLNGEFVANTPPRGNFDGFVAIHYLDYTPTREPGVTGGYRDPFPARPRLYPRYLFFAKIKIPVYNAHGELIRTDRVYYPLKKINADTFEIYRKLYIDYEAALDHGAMSAILQTTLENTQIQFSLDSLDGDRTLYGIIKDYCTAIGYSLRVEMQGGGYVYNSNLMCSAHEVALPIFADVPFLPDEVGEGCRLVANGGKILKAQHNYVVMGGKKIWGISQNDPLLPQEGNVAECDIVIYGNTSEGYELIANHDDSDDWGACHNVAYFAVRSPLWPERLYSMLGAWSVTFETHHFSFHLPKSTPFFQYENWLCAISSVSRVGSRYRIEAVAFVTFELLALGGDHSQNELSQGLMTPVNYGLEFWNIIPLREGIFFYLFYMPYQNMAITADEVAAIAADEKDLVESQGVQCEILQTNLSCLAMRYYSPYLARCYEVVGSNDSERWFAGLAPVSLLYGHRNGTRISQLFTASALDGTTTIFLRGELSTPLNAIISSATEPTMVVTTADGSSVTINDDYAIDNLDGHNKYNYAFCRGLRVPAETLEKIEITPHGNMVYLQFVLENWEVTH